jgi:hypothetical protein
MRWRRWMRELAGAASTRAAPGGLLTEPGCHMRGVVRNPRRWSVCLIALGVVAGTVFIAPVTARATTSDGDVVLGGAPGSLACIPGADTNCEPLPTSIVSPYPGPNRDAFDVVANTAADALDGNNIGGGTGVEGAGPTAGCMGRHPPVMGSWANSPTATRERTG